MNSQFLHKALFPVVNSGGARVALLKGFRTSFLVSALIHEALLSDDSLPSKTIYEVMAEISRLKRIGFWNEFPKPPRLSDRHFTLSLHLVHACNLACGYCNVQQGTYGDPPKFMSKETAFEALRFLDQKRDDHTPRLIFYGGEPLLNWDVLTAAVDLAERQFPNLEMEIVTNATLLDAARARFLAKHRIFAIISLDGPRNIHDHNRPTVSGKGSYDDAVRGLRNLKKAGARFHVRATWVPGSIAYEEVFHHLAGLAGDSKFVTVALEFQKAGDKGANEYYEALRRRYHDTRRMKDSEPPFAFSFIDQVLKGDLSPVPECEAGRSGFSVTPDGTLYPCQVSASLKYARLGTAAGGIDGEGRENLEAFLNRPSPACRDCWVRPYCSGPCAFSAPLMEAKPFCDVIKLQVREALAAVARGRHRDLYAPYKARSLSEENKRVLARAAALRAILWRENRHIKPLFLFPQGARET